MMKASDKTVLITGAAVRIGAEVARALHAHGCKTLLHYHSKRDAAEALADSLNHLRPDSAYAVSADLSTTGGVEKLVTDCLQFTDRLDLLVNNASRFYATGVGTTSVQQWGDLVNSNLRGAYFLSQGLLKPLREARGAIVNILDVHAQRPMSGHAVYCIAKAGMAMMTLALARELAPDIRVNGVSPGAILWPENPPEETVKHTVLQRIAMGRLGDPADIASAVIYLGLEASYVTGQILAVDGGRSLHM